jgi:hypothetical protein
LGIDLRNRFDQIHIMMGFVERASGRQNHRRWARTGTDGHGRARWAPQIGMVGYVLNLCTLRCSNLAGTSPKITNANKFVCHDIRANMATFHDFTRSYITFPQTYTIPRWKHSIDLYRIYAFCEAYLNSDPQMGFLEGAPEINHHGHGTSGFCHF